VAFDFTNSIEDTKICFLRGITVETITTETDMVSISATSNGLDSIQKAAASDKLDNVFSDTTSYHPRDRARTWSSFRGQEQVPQ
jgi:hypothetical protein